MQPQRKLQFSCPSNATCDLAYKFDRTRLTSEKMCPKVFLSFYLERLLLLPGTSLHQWLQTHFLGDIYLVLLVCDAGKRCIPRGYTASKAALLVRRQRVGAQPSAVCVSIHAGGSGGSTREGTGSESSITKATLFVYEKNSKLH